MTQNLFDLKDRVVVVTGSSRGIGRSTVEHLAAMGAKVVVSSRSAESCEPVAEGIREAGGDATVIPCHIGDTDAREQLIEQTMDHYGRLDGLVCNAASNPVYGPMSQVDEEVFDVIMRNNVWSGMQLAQLATPHLAKTDGAIVMVGSIVGMRGSNTIGTYGISKAAESQLVKNLAVELGGQGIRVNCVAPGLIRTDFARALLDNPKLVAAMEHHTPAGRVGEPEDIAGVIAFLLADASRYISGQTIVADGGVTIAEIL